MKKEFKVIIEMDAQGNYIARVPALRRCRTRAPSLGAVMENLREAIELGVGLKEKAFEANRSSGLRMTRGVSAAKKP